MTPIVLPLPDNTAAAERLASQFPAEHGYATVRRFHPGEGITSLHFARLLSGCVAWLVTVDPHLHRFQALAEIHAIPTHVVHSAPLIADRIREHVLDPVVEVLLPDIDHWHGHTPVLVDDIISTARTLIKAVDHLHQLGTIPHASNGIDVSDLLAGGARQGLQGWRS